jgi:isopentenyl-diphosphate delta-isomerase
MKPNIEGVTESRERMSQHTELVVLLDDDGETIGTAPKATVHTRDTALHLAFSCHVFDAEGRILVTRRAIGKLTWPGVWTNSFCGHPAPGEDMLEAVHRRAEQELGLTLASVELVLPDFRYRATDAAGVVENEICPVFRAVAATPVDPRPEEVGEYRWVDPEELIPAVAHTPWAFSPWLTLQLPLLYPEHAAHAGLADAVPAA